MIVAIDSTALAMLIDPAADVPLDPKTGAAVTLASDRIANFLDELGANRGTLLLPTPVLAEVLVRASDRQLEILNAVQKQAFVRVRSFDQASAIEYGLMTAEALSKGNKRAGHTQPWQRVKFDRQILAIARVNGASRLYSDDADLLKFAAGLGMKTVSTWELPVPEMERDLFTDPGLEPKTKA